MPHLPHPGPVLLLFTAGDRTLFSLFCAQAFNTPGGPRHTELLFLDQIRSWGLDTNKRYSITVFISWSPCPDCAHSLVGFLRENSHVSLRISAARIYSYYLGYEDGLRQLRAAGAEVSIMDIPGQQGLMGVGGGQREAWGKLLEKGGQDENPWRKSLPQLPAEGVLDSRRTGGVSWRRQFWGQTWSWDWVGGRLGTCAVETQRFGGAGDGPAAHSPGGKNLREQLSLGREGKGAVKQWWGQWVPVGHTPGGPCLLPPGAHLCVPGPLRV